MDKLGFDFVAIEVARLLNHRDRAAAIALLLKTLGAGTAKPETQRLAASIFGASRGQPKSGPKMWPEIGEDNYWLEASGMSAQARKEFLTDKYSANNVGWKHIEKCITMYNSGRAAGEQSEPE